MRAFARKEGMSMSTISELKSQRFKESETKRHAQDIKKIRSMHNKTFSKEVKKNEISIKQMKEEYETKVEGLEIELEQKLISHRNRQKDSLQREKMRLTDEVENLKKTHQDQVGEIKSSQANEIDELISSHKKTLENARQKFLKEKMKTENG